MTAQIGFNSGGTLDGRSTGAARIELFDAAGNVVSPVNGTNLDATQGALLISGKNDDTARVVRSDRFGNLMVGNHMLLLHEPFETTTINTQRWSAFNTTFVPAQTALGYNFNNTNLLTANAVAILVSKRQFFKQQRTPLQAKFRFKTSRVVNVQQEFGFGAFASAVLTVPANGTFFRIAGDTLMGVNVFNGVESTVTLTTSLGTDVGTWDTSFITFDVIVDDDEATFVVQNTSTGAILYESFINLPLTSNRMWAVSHLPIFSRIFNGAVAPSSVGAMLLSDVTVMAVDWNANNPVHSQVVSNQQGWITNPTTGAQAAAHVNSAEPANATLANTTASYTTLGGKFQFAAVAGAATDFNLFSWTNPAPYQFVITGFHVETWNTVIASATTPTLLEWSLGVNGASVNLSTGGHIRTPVLGVQSIPVGLAPGGVVNTIDRQFTTPIVCEAGLFLAVILRVPVSTATATQVIAGSVDIQGYYM